MDFIKSHLGTIFCSIYSRVYLMISSFLSVAEGVASILVHEPKKQFYIRFLHEAFPVESSLQGTGERVCDSSNVVRWFCLNIHIRWFGNKVPHFVCVLFFNHKVHVTSSEVLSVKRMGTGYLWLLFSCRPTPRPYQCRGCVGNHPIKERALIKFDLCTCFLERKDCLGNLAFYDLKRIFDVEDANFLWLSSVSPGRADTQSWSGKG